MKKLWSKRFSKSNSLLMEKFNSSIFFDRYLLEEDIAGSLAHTKMLRKIGLLNGSEEKTLLRGLKQVEQKLSDPRTVFSASEEDIHTKVEQELRNIVGPVAGKLHTARSRNDQVNNDLRLWTRKHLITHQKLLSDLIDTLILLAERHSGVIMPGFTHLQPAQPITYAYYNLCYCFMLERDIARLQDCLKRTNLSPLGSGALAGVNYPVDRVMVQEELGFDAVLPNAMDAVSDRDFLLEYGSALAIIMMHLSRMSEELILFSNQTFLMVEIDEVYSTGSSIMPNKKNPDSLELIRGKTGRVYGNLISLLSVMKGLPLAYNKDLQEDKEGIFDSVETVEVSLKVMTEVLKTIKIHPEKMLIQCEKGYLQATDVADYLVAKGLPFREAYGVSASIVSSLSQKNQCYQDLTLEDFRSYSPLFQKDIFQVILMERVIENKCSEGSTSASSVKKQIRQIKKKIASWRKMTSRYQ